MRVRCITVNVAGLRSAWFQKRYRLCVEELGKLAPDFVFLQESTLRLGHEAYDQAETIASALGLPAVAFSPYGNPDEPSGEEHDGVAVLSRWPLLYGEAARCRRAFTSPTHA